MKLAVLVRRRRRRLLACAVSAPGGYIVQALAAGVLAAHDPIADGLRGSLLILCAAVALLSARVFLFLVVPAWVAGEVVALAWDARAGRQLPDRGASSPPTRS